MGSTSNRRLRTPAPPWGEEERPARVPDGAPPNRGQDSAQNSGRTLSTRNGSVSVMEMLHTLLYAIKHKAI